MKKIQDNNYVIFSDQRGLSTRICPRGSVTVCIGHTSVAFRTEDFLHFAEVVSATQQHLLLQEMSDHGETKH